jgi:type I restriction enzyme R subunit
MAVLVKNPERLRAVLQHMVTHYQTKVEPNGFKAQGRSSTANAVCSTSR